MIMILISPLFFLTSFRLILLTRAVFSLISTTVHEPAFVKPFNIDLSYACMEKIANVTQGCVAAPIFCFSCTKRNKKWLRTFAHQAVSTLCAEISAVKSL